MSTTDHAFIRAYGQPKPVAGVAARPQAPAAYVADDPLAIDIHVVGPSAAGTITHTTDVHGGARVDPAAATAAPFDRVTDRPATVRPVRGPHYSVQSPRPPASEPLAGQSRELRRDDSHGQFPPAETPPTSKQPLAQIRPATAVDGQLQAETTIAAFRFPTICGQLLSHAGDQLATVAETIVAAAEAGRSLIGIASTNPGEGCTTMLLCLARLLATQGQQVALVDGNLSEPALADRLNLSPNTTWQDVLTRGVPVAEALIHAVEDGMTVLPATPAATGHHGSANSGLQASITAGALRYAYDVVLVDLGPLLDVHQGPLAAELLTAMRIDGVVIVSGSGSARTQAAHAIVSGGTPVLGYIEMEN